MSEKEKPKAFAEKIEFGEKPPGEHGERLAAFAGRLADFLVSEGLDTFACAIRVPGQRSDFTFVIGGDILDITKMHTMMGFKIQELIKANHI